MALIGAITVASSVAWIVGRHLAAPPYRGPTSDHFDGRRFHNQTGDTDRGLTNVLRWKLTRDPGPWGEHPDAPAGPPPPRRVGRGALRVTFINHATVLIQMDGLNILTDPIWSQRASPFSWAGPRRRRPPGIRFEDLPPIDVVLISHDHYDHLDLPTLARLARAHHPRFVCPLGDRALLEANHIAGSIELDWGQAAALSPEVRVAAVPAVHTSTRGFGDRDHTLWAGFVLIGPGGPVFFAGDTAFGPQFEESRRRDGPPRLALLPIGSYRPTSLMSPVHMSPDDAVRAHRALQAGTSVAIHFGTFPLTDDGEAEPPARLRAVLARDPQRFWVLAPGEGRDVPPAH
jgi:L-ascorbate metabolism protein UlaG (beta-lactamase superfamily)